MRFLHTADWHLGRIFHGLHLTEDQAYVLNELVALAVEAKVDAILIAGDIYDRAVPPTQAVNLLDETLSLLIQKHNIPVIMIAGNHDNPARLGFGKKLLAESRLFIYGTPVLGTQPVILEDKTGPVYFAPFTYTEPPEAAVLSGETISLHEDALAWQLRDMAPFIPAQARKVALAHVFLTGSEESPDSERPLSIGGTTTVSADYFKSFNYTALGHLHACQQAGNTIRYSGSLLKYSFNEVNQTKGIHIVDLDASGNCSVETIFLKPRHELAVLKGTFADLLNKPQLEAQTNYLQIILEDDAPILDAKYRLESVYPHILHLEYTRLQAATKDTNTTSAQRKLGPLELFSAFFQQVTERSLTEPEQALLQETVNALDTA
ncbi:MAG TPA: exonuclease SbcCD subunit D, partial [Candidatus Avacidaminococcus intestinavium]|nr:exonuclease SbcCD subunit D [Candidatus Avacidaminococcus intestinavium]